jgi:hypothetical protein
MMKLLTIVMGLLFAMNLVADSVTDEMISDLPRGEFAGSLKSTGGECALTLKATYDNVDKYVSAVINTKDQKLRASLSGHSVITKFIKISDSTSLIRSTYAWAECCHSGSRDEVYLEIVEGKISSVRIENFEDVGAKLSDIKEEKISDETCVLSEPVAI